jgi:hypothetical protein
VLLHKFQVYLAASAWLAVPGRSKETFMTKNIDVGLFHKKLHTHQPQLPSFALSFHPPLPTNTHPEWDLLYIRVLHF